MEYRLEELFDLQMGKTPARNNPRYWGTTDNKWISIADLSKCGKYIKETKEYLSDVAIAESGISQIPANTVIMSFKLSIGKTAITYEPMYSNEAIMSFRDKHFIDLLPEYIYYLLVAHNWDEGTNKAVMGKTLNKATLSKVKVHIHPLEKQEKIVSILNKLTDAIQEHQQQLQKLDEVIKSRFVEMFGNPIINTKGWPKKRFDEICENLDSRRKPITASEREAGRYPYYGASGVVDYVANYIFDEDLLLVSEDGANLLMRSTPIAFSVSGKVWVNNHAHVVRFKEMSMQKYIEIYFSMIDISDQITGSAQPKLNQAKLNAIRFAIPNEALLDEYYDFIKKVDKSKLHKFVTSQYDILKEGIYNAVIQN